MRIICIFLSAAAVTALSVACGGDPRDKNNTSVSGSLAEALSKSDVRYLSDDGGPAYRVVRPENGSDEENQAAMLVFRSIKSAFDVIPSNVTDFEDDDAAEILVGETNREATAAAKRLLLQSGTGRSVEYIICTIGDDIVIYGMTDASTVTAAQYFVDHFIKEPTVSGGINCIYNASHGYSDVKIGKSGSIKEFKIVRPIYNVSYLTQTETDKLIDAITDKTGYTLELTDDKIASDNGRKTDGSGTLTPTEASEYEIIIGNCLRDGVNKINDYNRYEIRIEGKKVYLNGGSAYATTMAVSEFIKMIEGNTEITAGMSVADGDYNAAAANYDSAEYYKPTFWENFDFSDGDIYGIDDDKWTVPWGAHTTSYGLAANGKNMYRNNFALKNCYVDGGRLYMEALETDTEYWGGWFETMSKMYYRYGYIETSSVHPKGMGFWNALWMRSNAGAFEDILPECKNTVANLEVDVDECYGPGDYVLGNTFAWLTNYGRQQIELPSGKNALGKNNRRSSADDRGFFMDFHTYGFEWLDNTHVRFTCDGYAYADYQLKEVCEQAAFSNPAYLIIGYAVGSGQWGEPTTDPDEWNNTNKWITDYIYIYQKSGQEMFKLIKGKWTDVGVWNTH